MAPPGGADSEIVLPVVGIPGSIRRRATRPTGHDFSAPNAVGRTAWPTSPLISRHTGPPLRLRGSRERAARGVKHQPNGRARTMHGGPGVLRRDGGLPLL